MVRSELYKKRFSKFIPITLAYDVSQKTIGSIEENNPDFIGIYTDVEAIRNYPGGKLFSHILGYIRGINSEELEEYKNKGYKDYTLNDIVGKEGLEKSFEVHLNGKDGKTSYEVDNLGRKIKENKELSVSPIPGNDIFLTLDANLQEVAYNALETTLKDVIINRLLGKNKHINYQSKDIYASIVRSNNLDMKKIMNSDPNTSQDILKKYVLSKNKNNIKDLDEARKILSDGIKENLVSQTNVVLAMFEQGIITADENYITRVKVKNISPLQVLIDKLNSLEITPHMTGMLSAPASGSVIVNDIHSGDILVSVSYPSYDNNKLVNTFDNEYYTKINTDPTGPMLNRPFTEPRAPGSTFKLIPAIAALESGLINPNTNIYDKGTFTEAGKPYARCWIGGGNGSHGQVNVAKSLEVSCNYFYYDISYRMGIGILNHYMKAFGLNDRSGVEIYELYDSSYMQNYPTKISSPEYKRYITSLRNPDTNESDLAWTAGNTIRTAIGQDFNNYTAAILTKYIATVVNGGNRYSLHFLNKIVDSKGNIVKEYIPILENKVNISQENLDAVLKGMYQVTSGPSGTLRNDFRNFPVKVGAKSGTAQESSKLNNHNVFTGFAPYDSPQIAITVFIPYGDDSYSPAPKITKKIIEEYMGLNKQPEKYYNNTLTK